MLWVYYNKIPIYPIFYLFKGDYVQSMLLQSGPFTMLRLCETLLDVHANVEPILKLWVDKLTDKRGQAPKATYTHFVFGT